MNFILRLFLTFSSISFFVIIYLVQKDINLLGPLGDAVWTRCLIYVGIPFSLGLISLALCKCLSETKINKVISLETSNNDFLANYLAFFFVALTIEGQATFWVVFGLTMLFTFVSRISYYNPILLVFGYKFYYVRTGENVKIMLISKKKLKSPENFREISVRCINDYTFIET